MNLEELLELSINAAKLGGEEIMKIYETDFDVSYKEDNSPVTNADENCNSVIMEHLETTNIPVLSEEGTILPYEERKDLPYLWIVDPLDGTKEFVKRSGEFTVNIALVRNQEPILGVIYVPVSGCLYFGAEGIGSFKQELDLAAQKLPLLQNRDTFVLTRSRAYYSDRMKVYIEKLNQKSQKVELLELGSSLKICLVAEGMADVYPRFAPTMEWDIAAGHAIAKYAGKELKDWNTGTEMKYNRRDLKNNWFVVQ